jgi:hypothetical protein
MDENGLLNEAENAVERVPEYATWGQVALNVWEAVWANGAWQPFDASIHRVQDRRVRIELTVIAIDEMQARYNAELKTTQDGHDWAGVTLPSIKALGVPVASLKNAFVKIVKKPNGKTYKKKVNGVETGELGKLTDFLFEKVFTGMDACVADYLSEKAGEPATAASAADFPVDAPQAVPSPAPVASGPSMDMLINFARNFVKAAVKAHPGDLAAITADVTQQLEVKNSSFFAGKLSASSPEITAMIMMEMG